MATSSHAILTIYSFLPASSLRLPSICQIVAKLTYLRHYVCFLALVFDLNNGFS
jgi:hypothetical protein